MRHINPHYMKKILSLVLVVFLSFSGFSQQWVPITSDTPSEATASLISANESTTVFKVELGGYYSSTVNTTQGDASILSVEGSTPLLVNGAPDVPKVAVSLIIPDAAQMVYNIVSSEFIEIEDILLAPSKGSLSRTIDPATIPYEFGDTYNLDAFYPGEMANLQEPYIVRDHRGQAAWVYPFRYNPVTKTLRVYYNVVVEVTSTDAKGVNILSQKDKPATINSQFNEIYNRHFINAGQEKYTALEEAGKMLIISYPDFMYSMQPLVEWRIKTGHPTEMVDVTTIGGSAQIKSFIADYYNLQGLTYVLLVGDESQVPTSYSNGDSDNDYSYIVGSDHYPELFIGRFSAENVDDVITQVTRTVDYEKTPFNGSDWHSHNIGIGSDQGPGDDNEYDYTHIRNLQIVLEAFTYTESAELFDGNQGGNDASGNPTPSMVAAEIEDGSSLINYVGHGSTTSWGTTGFSNSDVNNLTNTNLLPYIFSVACVNGNFVGNTCFAEAWMRATHDNQPSGAVAVIMSTINQDWNEPMEGQDAMNDILGEVYPDNIKRTFGGVTFNGMMQMMDSYGNSSFDMADTWTIFGDPALNIRTAQPMAMTVSHNPAIFFGLNSFTVTCNKNGALATLVQDGVLIDTKVVAGNEATFTFDPFTELGEVDITITAFNCVPYLATIPIMGGAPGLPANPVPDDMGNGVSLLTNFVWQQLPGGDAEGSTFFLGTDNPPTNVFDGVEVIGNTFLSDVTLDPETEYFWQIKSFNGYGVVEGPVWSFTTKNAPDEDFETGDFSSNNWTFGGDADWVIDTENSRSGNNSACSGAITDGQTTSLQLSVESSSFGKISFWVKPSCEMENDNITFVVNGATEMTWTGTPAAWVEYSYFVGPGPYVFEWIYTKDANGGAAGSDCAWVDFMYLPSATMISCQAGDDQTVCSDSQVQLQGVASNYSSLSWSTSGDGSFDDATILNPVYTFGDEDITNKTVTLTIAANGTTGNSSDEVVIAITQAPEAFAGDDMNICSGDEVAIDYATATNFQSLLWTTSGDGAFSDEATLKPVYTPGAEDIANGNVILTLTALGDAPCAQMTSEMMVEINATPTAPSEPVGPVAVDLVYVTESSYSVDAVETATSYSWMVEPVDAGTILVQDPENNALIQWNSSFVGEALISVNAANECGASNYSQTLPVMVDNTVGIDDMKMEASIFPNPSNGIFQVVLSENRAATIEVYTLTGELVLQNSIEEGTSKVVLNMQNSAKGVYFVKISGMKSTLTQKLVIK